MLNLRTGTVTEVLERREGIEKVRVSPDGEEDALRQAINYPSLSGSVDPGDRVLLNTTGVDLELGTGGWDFVVANLSRLERETRFSVGEPTSGHLMKMRYTPLQAAFQSAEEAYDLPVTLKGRPVVVAELHSQIAPLLLGLKAVCESAEEPYPRVAYVMPDTGAIPLTLSETMPTLKERGLIHTTVTCGHAFGGDFEAVTLGSGLAVAAGPAEGDVIVVAQGPGSVGTGSALGFGAIYQVEALHLAYALDASPLFVPRISYADPRPRHHQLSHHSRTVLERLLLCEVMLCLPEASPRFRDPLNAVSLRMRQRMGYAPLPPLEAALEKTDLPLRSMGRDYRQDPYFFLAAAAGGWRAGLEHFHRAKKETTP